MDTLGFWPAPNIPPETIDALLPGFGKTSFCEVNLDSAARQWRGRHSQLMAENPLLDPYICQSFLDEIHARLHVTWSYGGYLEDRHHLLQGSYLERTGSFVHLGVDINVPQSTPIATPGPGVVLLVDDDHDRDGGWGPRVFLRLDDETLGNPVLIFAHLQGIEIRPGTRLPQGAVFAEVGGPPENGNWVSHLHVQAIRSERLFRVLIERPAELDGYGSVERIEDLRENFPNPLPLIGWR